MVVEVKLIEKPVDNAFNFYAFVIAECKLIKRKNDFRKIVFNHFERRKFSFESRLFRKRGGHLNILCAIALFGNEVDFLDTDFPDVYGKPSADKFKENEVFEGKTQIIITLRQQIPS